MIVDGAFNDQNNMKDVGVLPHQSWPIASFTTPVRYFSSLETALACITIVVELANHSTSMLSNKNYIFCSKW